MDRRLSRTVMPAVAATVLATLLAQPILAAKPTITDTHSEGPNAIIAGLVQTACGVSGVSAYSIVDIRRIEYGQTGKGGLRSIQHIRQRIQVSTNGAAASLAQAATIRTYVRDGHTFVAFSGRNLGYGVDGRVLYRDGAEISRSGHPISYASELCPRLTPGNAGAGAATDRGRPASSGSERASSSAVPSPRIQGERGRSAAAHAAKLDR